MSNIAGACRRGMDSYFAHFDECAGGPDMSGGDLYQGAAPACAAAALAFFFVTMCLAAAPL